MTSAALTHNRKRKRAHSQINCSDRLFRRGSESFLIVITDTYIPRYKHLSCSLSFVCLCVLLLLMLLLFEMFFVAPFVLCVLLAVLFVALPIATHTPPPHARHTSTHYFGRQSIISCFFCLVVVFQPNNLSLLDIYYY